MSLLDSLRRECLVRPGRIETSSWRIRWDADAIVVSRPDSLREPQRVSGEGVVVQLSSSRGLALAGSGRGLLGRMVSPSREQTFLDAELRGGELRERLRLRAVVDEPEPLLDGLDELALEDADLVSLEALLDLLHTAIALGAGLALSAGASPDEPGRGSTAVASLRAERDRHLVSASRLQRERDALRADKSRLEQSLSEALSRVAALEQELGEVERLRRQVAGLDFQLGQARARIAELEPLERAMIAGDTGPEGECPRCRESAGRASVLLPAAPEVRLGGRVLCGCAVCGYVGFGRRAEGAPCARRW